jgi:hypothetical protein
LQGGGKQVFLFLWLQEGSILNARFPVAGEIDVQAMKAAEYFANTIGDFRLRLKTYLQPKVCPQTSSRILLDVAWLWMLGNLCI